MFNNTIDKTFNNAQNDSVSGKELYKTVNINDPDFVKLMNGDYSATHRSIPLQPLNNQIKWEMTTFELIPIEKIKSPSIAELIFEIIKPQHFLVILVPVLFCILNLAQYDFNFGAHTFLLLTALFFLSAFVNIQRTLSEHFQNTFLFASAPASVSLLRKGWISAGALKKISNGVLVLTILASLSFFFKNPLPVAIISVFSGFLISLIHRQREFKYSHYFSALSHFLLSGPLLVLGSFFALTQSALHFSTGTVTFEGADVSFSFKDVFVPLLIFGISWGLWISLWRQLKSFSKIFSFSQGKNVRFVTVMGFDKSVSFLNKSIIAIPLMGSCIMAIIPNGWSFALASALVHSYFIPKELQVLNKIQSSLSSDSEVLAATAQRHHSILSIVYIALMMVHF